MHPDRASHLRWRLCLQCQVPTFNTECWQIAFPIFGDLYKVTYDVCHDCHVPCDVSYQNVIQNKARELLRPATRDLVCMYLERARMDPQLPRFPGSMQELP